MRGAPYDAAAGLSGNGFWVMRLFTEHPASVGQSYGAHLLFAARVGGRMMLGGLACVIHGLLPFLFQTTGSRTIRALHDEVARPRHADGEGRGPGTTEPEYLI